MGHTAGLDAVAKKKIPASAKNKMMVVEHVTTDLRVFILKTLYQLYRLYL